MSPCTTSVTGKLKLTNKGKRCDDSLFPVALGNIIAMQDFTYQEIFSHLSEKQKELLIAIAKEKKAEGVTSARFIKQYKLSSASSVQSALKGLAEKDMVTSEHGFYQVYDKLFGVWLRQNY